jgi:hypothetical protein
MKTLRWILPAIALLLATGTAAAATADTVWFEVGAHDARTPQSYLLPLQRPAQIAQARARLALGEASGVGAVVVARIGAGGDGLNRNLREARPRPWSWHVAEFVEFADLAIELCDGSPGLVQDDPAGFIANTDGMICFWGYSLVAELPAPPRIAIDDALDGFWHAPAAVGTGFLVDVLPDQRLLGLAWLTYAADGQDRLAQRWLIGAGAIGDDDAIAVELVAPAAPQAPALTSARAELEFIDCNTARLRIEADGTPLHELDLRRTVPAFACGR